MATSGQKQLKEKDMAGIYQNLIISTVAKLNVSFKRAVRPYVPLLMNGLRLNGLYNTGANNCCSKAFRRVFPMEQRPEKLNRTSNGTATSSNTPI
jgi:hypothetical protein